MDLDATRAAARAALLDPEVREIRHECLQRLAEGLEWAGNVLRIAGTMVGRSPSPGVPPDPRLVGMGYVANTASSLLHGALMLHDAGNGYATAALVRQVVETEYLAWAFAEDQEEAGAWLVSSQSDRISRWQPKHIRKRSAGRFRGKDYGDHCEKGGHPTPVGCRFFFTDGADVRTAGLLVDSLLHGRSTWRYLMTGVDLHAATLGVAPDVLLSYKDRTPAHNAVESWWDYDPFKPYFLMNGVVSGGP